MSLPTAGTGIVACSSSNNDVNASGLLLRLGQVPLDDGWEDWEALVASTSPACPPHRIRMCFCIRTNCWAILKKAKPGSALFLTISVARDTDQGPGVPLDSVALQRFVKSITPLLDEQLESWLLVLEYEPDTGVPHLHGIGIARDDVEHGWRHPPYEAAQTIRRQARLARRALTAAEAQDVERFEGACRPNRRLRGIWKAFREGLVGCRARVNATPINDWRKCIAYIVKDIKQPNRGNELKRSGSASWFHSASFSPVCTTDFCWNGQKNQLNRARKTRIASVLRLAHQTARPEERFDASIKQVFGDRTWHCHLEQLIGALNRADAEWLSKTDREVMLLIEQALRENGEPWADDALAVLRERRRGLIIDQPGYSILDDLLEVAARRQRDHQVALPDEDTGERSEPEPQS